MIDRLVTNIFERCDLIQKFCRQSRGSRLRSPFCRYSIDQIGKRPLKHMLPRTIRHRIVASIVTTNPALFLLTSLSVSTAPMIPAARPHETIMIALVREIALLNPSTNVTIAAARLTMPNIIPVFPLRRLSSPEFSVFRPMLSLLPGFNSVSEKGSNP